MFFLENKTSYDVTAALPQAKEGVKYALDRLADSTRGLTFDEKEHRYFLHGREMASVSSIVEAYAPFDKYGTAAKCSVNPRHKFFGKPVEEIVAIWEADGLAAAQAGTDVHAFGEACALFMQGRLDEIEEPFRDRITPQGLRADTPKEEAVARWWSDQDWWRFTIVAKETRIANPVLGYAGTFDLLLYDVLDNTYHVRDYKTNRDLYKWYGDMLLPPLNMLKRNDIGKYTVQQTSYTIELRNLDLDIRSNELIWLKEREYETVQLPMNYDRVVAYAIKQVRLSAK
jgi:hypothetical protein